MYTYASFGKRLLAFIMDSFIIGILSSILIYVLTPSFESIILCNFLLGPLYFILFEGSDGNATLGKKVMGIKVTDRNGRPIGYGVAAIRYLGRVLSSIILLIGYIMVVFSNTSQALHDMLAGTLVVETELDTTPIVHHVGSGENPYLIGITGEYAGKSFPIKINGIMLGRDNVACQIIFGSHAKGVSRHHCMIKYNADTSMFVINDIGSSYGTFLVSGTKIGSTPTAIKNGERFYLGSQSNMFEVRLKEE